MDKICDPIVNDFYSLIYKNFKNTDIKSAYIREPIFLKDLLK